LNKSGKKIERFGKTTTFNCIQYLSDLNQKQ